MTTNLTDKFDNQAAVLRGTRENDVVSALVEELPSPIGAQVNDAIVAGPLAQNIANDLVASDLAGNIGDEVATSALAANIATALDSRLALLPTISSRLEAIEIVLTETIYPAIQELQAVTGGGLSAVVDAVAALAACCAALGLGIEGLREDVQAGNAQLGKIGDNQTNPPPEPAPPPPVPTDPDTYYVCGVWRPVWVYVGSGSGLDVWKAASSGPGGPLGTITGANGWGAAETDGYGLYFDAGTYSSAQIGGAGGVIKRGGSGGAGTALPVVNTYAAAATQIDYYWEGSGSPGDAQIRICRQLTIA